MDNVDMITMVTDWIMELILPSIPMIVFYMILIGVYVL